MNNWAHAILLWSWQALLLVALTLVLVRIHRSGSARVRHSIWLLGILAIAVLPAANAIIHALPAAPEAIAPITFVAHLPATVLETAPASPASDTAGSSLLVPSLFALWLTGVLIAVARTARDLARWRRIRSSARCTESVLHGVPLCYSDQVESPTLAGIFRPRILLPATIGEWANDEELEAVVRHELAHVTRRDHLVSLVHAALGTVFFFHPAVRYALRQLVLERELACDEEVLAAGTRPHVYADIILKTAERSIQARQSNCPAFNSSRKILGRRIDMIVNYRTSTSNGWRFMPAARATLVLAVAALVLPLQQPRTLTAQELSSAPVLQLPGAQPLMEGVTLIAKAIVKEASPEPVQTAPPQAQAAQTGISGAVFDQTGAVVPGVTVSVTAGSTGVRQTQVTNIAGSYSFSQLDPGPYSLQVSLPGFQPNERAVSVRQGTLANGDILLALRKLSTQVEVSGARGAATAATAPSRPTVIPRGPLRVGGEVAQANLISAVKPVYPASARERQIQGTVQLQAVIDVSGNIVGLQIDNAVSMDLAQAAMDAVRQWKYKPTFLNGQPVELGTTIVVNFSLAD